MTTITIADSTFYDTPVEGGTYEVSVSKNPSTKGRTIYYDVVLDGVKIGSTYRFGTGGGWNAELDEASAKVLRDEASKSGCNRGSRAWTSTRSRAVERIVKEVHTARHFQPQTKLIEVNLKLTPKQLNILNWALNVVSCLPLKTQRVNAGVAMEIADMLPVH